MSESALIKTLLEYTVFLAPVASLFASVVCFQLTRKFGRGVLANGFQEVAVGVLFISVGLFIDALIVFSPLDINFIRLVSKIALAGGAYIILIAIKGVAKGLEKI